MGYGSQFLKAAIDKKAKCPLVLVHFPSFARPYIHSDSVTCLLGGERLPRKLPARHVQLGTGSEISLALSRKSANCGHS